MRIIIFIFKKLLQLVYYIRRISPPKGGVLIISRQADTPSIDIRLLEEALRHLDPGLRIQVMCRYSKSAAEFSLSYLLYLMGPILRAFADADVVVLDGYCIPASVLRHRKELKIIQMWHAMGAFKKFGLALLGDKEGQDPQLARMMCMHKNYDVVFASSRYCVPYFARAFGYPEDKLAVMPLPRVDFIKKKAMVEDTRVRILSRRPELYADGIKALYAPTFRKDADNEGMMRKLAQAAQRAGITLIIRPHPILNIGDDIDGAFVENEFESIELLSVCDVVISDYSAFILEAALSDKPIYRYLPDADSYESGRGFFTDMTNEWPGSASDDADELCSLILKGDCDMDGVRAFADKYVEYNGECAKNIAGFVLSMLDHGRKDKEKKQNTGNNS